LLWNALGLALAASWFALLNGWLPLLLLLAAAAIHEGGHWLALRLCGVPVTSFQLQPFGAVMTTWNCRLSYPQELLAVLAGPAANLLCGALLTISGDDFLPAAGAHLVLALFNLLPVGSLDGGHALTLVLTLALGPDRGEHIAGVVGLAFGLTAAAGLAILMICSRGNLWLAPVMAGLAIAGVKNVLPNQTRRPA
jgi:Zn-dependent protease